MASRLWLRVFLIFSAVVVIALGTAAVLMQQATVGGFGEYVEDVQATQRARIESTLLRYYNRSGSWDGVEQTVERLGVLAGRQLVLVDEDNKVIADSNNRLVGVTSASDWKGASSPLLTEGRPVGMVYIDPIRPQAENIAREEAFLTSHNYFILWATILGLLISLVLSLLLARRVTSSLDALIRAADAMSRGDLNQRVKIDSRDELGQLGGAFNMLAESLQRVERLRRDMVTDIGHELRTPITTIRGYMEGIQDGVMKPTPDVINLVHREILALHRLVDDLQELSLAEAGKLRLDRSLADLNKIVVEVASAFQPQLPAKSIEMTIAFGRVPPANIDQVRIGQVLRNLVNNALAFTPEGGKITIATGATPSEVWFSVADNGPGIEPEHLPYIFERFYRADKSRSRSAKGGGGTGLGLTIAKGLVEAHGGKIGVKSAPGTGTEFKVILPRGDTAEAPAAARADILPVKRGLREYLVTGALVGVLLGMIGGAAEAVSVALSLKKPQVLDDVLAYAITIDGLSFGFVAAFISVGVGLGLRLVKRNLDEAKLVGGILFFGLLAMSAIIGLRLIERISLQPLFGQGTLPVVLAIVVASGVLALMGGRAARTLVGRLGTASFKVQGYSLVAVLVLLFSISSAKVYSDSRPNGTSPSRAMAEASGKQDSPNVLLITIDTLRADRVQPEQQGATKAPNLENLAREGAFFSRAFSPQPNTNPAHASIFTGTYPSTHGVREHMVDRLSPSVPTLAGILSDKGYTTAGIYSWISLDPQYSGLDTGYQFYEGYIINRPKLTENPVLARLGASYRRLTEYLAVGKTSELVLKVGESIEEKIDGRADITTDAALKWLRDNYSKPFFLWLHYFDPHYPYSPPPPFDRMYDPDYKGSIDGSVDTIYKIAYGELIPDVADTNHLIALYDGEVTFTDQQVGRVLAALDALGLKDNTIVIITGDHGESLGEHGYWFRGGAPYDTEVNVPLIISYPPAVPSGVVSQSPAGLVDIMPTVLDILGIEIPKQVEGKSLLPLTRGESNGNDGVVFSQLNGNSIAVVTNEWKLILNGVVAEKELYHISEDPGELENRVNRDPEVVDRLEKLLREWMAKQGIGG